MKLTPLEKLLEKEVERKEFLVYIGLFLLALTGIPGFFKSISETTRTNTNSSNPKSFGFGSYGGVEKKGRKLNG